MSWIETITETLMTPSSLDLITPWWYKIEDINVILFVTIGFAVDVVQWTQGIIKCYPQACLTVNHSSHAHCQLQESTVFFVNLHCTSLLPWHVQYYPYFVAIVAILMFTLHRLPILWNNFSTQLSRVDTILQKLQDLDVNMSTNMQLHCRTCNKCTASSMKPWQQELTDEECNTIKQEAERAVFDRHGKLVFSSSIIFILLASPCGKIALCFVIAYILRPHYAFISKVVHHCPVLDSKLLHELQPVVCIHVSPVSVRIADLALLCMIIMSLMVSIVYLIMLGQRAIRLYWQCYHGTDRVVVMNTEDGQHAVIRLDTRRLTGFVYLYDVIKACKKVPIKELVWLLGHGRGVWGEHIVDDV